MNEQCARKIKAFRKCRDNVTSAIADNIVACVVCVTVVIVF